MSEQLGEAQVPIRATLDKLDADLADARSKIEKSLSGVRDTATKIGKAALIGITAGLLTVGTAATVVGGRLVGMGADANETASLLQTSLGGAATSLNDELRQFADDANRSFYELQAGSATFVAMTRSMGATQDQAADLGVSFTKAGTDLGSFFNIPTEDALMDIQSALAGSSETMTKYGIDIRETTLKQMALDQGLITSASETLPQLMRAQLIQQAIMEQGADAMGDAERTSDSWQNTMRGLTGKLRDAGTEIGQKLIPALTPFLTLVGDLAAEWLPKLGDILSSTVIPAIQMVAETVASFVGNLEEGMSPLDAFIEAIWDIAPQEVLDALIRLRDEILPGLVSWFETTVKPLLDMAAGFVEWQDVAIAAAIAIGAIVIPIIWGILSPILAVIAVGAALVAAIALIRNAWENDWGGIRTYLLDVWQNTIQPTLAALGVWITDVLIPTILALWDQWVNVVWPAIQAALLAAWEFIQPILLAIGDWIMTTLIPTILELWEQWVNVVWPAIQTALETAWAFIQPILAAIGDWILNTLLPAVQDLWKKWVEEIWPDIQTALENAWTAIKAIWEELGRWINDNIVPWVEFLHKKWVEEIWPAIQKAVEAVWDIIQPIWEKFREYLEDKLPPALEGLQSVMESVMTAVHNAIQPVKDLWDALVAAVSGFWDWISSHTFSFKISIPDLPDWAVPGSPLPIHTAWKNFEQDMNPLVIAPQIDLGDGNNQRQTSYQIDAYYSQYQSERSLRDDIQLLQLLTGNG